MVKRIVLLLIAVLACATGFQINAPRRISFQINAPRRISFQINAPRRISWTLHAVAIDPPSGIGKFITDFINNIIRVLPEVMKPIPAMDAESLVKSPPRYIKPSSSEGFHKSGKNKDWEKDDVISHFNERYGIASTTKENMRLASFLDDLDEMGMLHSLDEYINRGSKGTGKPHEQSHLIESIVNIEKYLAEGVEHGFSSIDKKMDPSKVEKNPPRLHKPVKLSDLKKTLQNNPHYFQ